MVVIKPVAAFSANVVSGDCPLEVQFTDESTNAPTQWFRDFGDGNTSLEQNPVNTYYKEGSYSVSLLASNSAGEDKEEKAAYINPSEITPGQENFVNIDPARKGRDSYPPISTDKEPVSTDRDYRIDYAEDGLRNDHQDILA